MTNIYESYKHDIILRELSECFNSSKFAKFYNNEFDAIQSLNETSFMIMPDVAKPFKSVERVFKVPTLNSIRTFLLESVIYLKWAALSLLSGAAIAHLIGLIFSALAKFIDKNVDKNRKAVEALINKKILAKMNGTEYSDEDFIKTYKDYRKIISRELKKKIPMNNGEKWASALDSTGRVIRGKYGMLVGAIAGLVIFGNIMELPVIGTETIKLTVPEVPVSKAFS